MTRQNSGDSRKRNTVVITVVQIKRWIIWSLKWSNWLCPKPAVVGLSFRCGGSLSRVTNPATGKHKDHIYKRMWVSCCQIYTHSEQYKQTNETHIYGTNEKWHVLKYFYTLRKETMHTLIRNNWIYIEKSKTQVNTQVQFKCIQEQTWKWNPDHLWNRLTRKLCNTFSLISRWHCFPHKCIYTLHPIC